MQNFDGMKPNGTKRRGKFLETSKAEGGRDGLFFEDLQPLAGLPFLVGILARRGRKKAVIVGGGLGFLVKRIVCCSPKEEG
jgi:hypothetical protein